MRIYRANMSKEQRNSVKLYDRNRKRDLRYENSESSSPKLNYHQVLYRSNKIRKLLGNESECHSQVLCHVLRKSLYSPRKQKSISSHCKYFCHFLEAVPKQDSFETPKKDLNNLLRKLAIYRSAKKYKQAREIVDLISSKTKNIASTACSSGNEYSHVYRLMKSPKRRVMSESEYKRKFSDVQKEEAMNIYFDPEVSYCLPDKKYSHLRFMSCTIDEAYTHYLDKSTSERKMARSTFAELKPLFIRSIAETPIRGCKCEYCQNIGLIRDTLIGIGFKGIPKNHSCSIEITWCQFRKSSDCDEFSLNSQMHDCSEIHESTNSDDQLPEKNCILRQCSACGTEKYNKVLKHENKQLLRKNGFIQWTQWKLKKVFNGKKNVKRMLPTLVEGTYQQLLEEYIKQLKAISLHQFMKIWQLKNFNITLRNL